MPKPPPIHLLDAETKVEEFHNPDPVEWAEFSRELDEFRFRYSGSDTQGAEEFYRVRDGVFLHTIDIQEQAGAGSNAVALADHLGLLFKLNGHNVLKFEDGQCCEIGPGTLTMAYTEVGESVEDRALTSERYVMAIVFVKPEALLAPPFSLAPDTLPDMLKPFIESQYSGRFLKSLVIDIDTKRCLQDLLTCRLSGPLRRAYIEAKVVELICLAVSAMIRSEASQCRRALSARDCDLLEQARVILQEQYSTPPALAELAAQVGMSERKLKQRFKGLFGMTTSEYVQQLRMNRAQELLGSRVGNIGQIANALGYEHASNFIAAFKRQYGLTPKAYQKQLLSQAGEL